MGRQANSPKALPRNDGIPPAGRDAVVADEARPAWERYHPKRKAFSNKIAEGFSLRPEKSGMDKSKGYSEVATPDPLPLGSLRAE
jgi:hypothetical protein